MSPSMWRFGLFSNISVLERTLRFRCENDGDERDACVLLRLGLFLLGCVAFVDPFVG